MADDVEQGPSEPDDDQQAARVSIQFTPEELRTFAGVAAQAQESILASMPPVQPMFQQVTAAIAAVESVLPAIEMSVATAYAGWRNVAPQLDRLAPMFEVLAAQQRSLIDQFSNLFPIRAPFPPNWDDVKLPDQALLEAMLLDEGLALAWTPPQDVLRQLIAAKGPAVRRQIIGRRWRNISTACREQLETVTTPLLRNECKFGLRAVLALENGHHEAAQALATNLLDTILREFARKDREQTTGQQRRPTTADYDLRGGLVFLGIWGAHHEFWPSKGDPIPYVFSRHATAHGVSSRQFSLRNSVISVMHVVALIKLLEFENS